MSEVRVRKLQEFIKQEASQILLRIYAHAIIIRMY